MMVIGTRLDYLFNLEVNQKRLKSILEKKRKISVERARFLEEEIMGKIWIPYLRERGQLKEEIEDKFVREFRDSKGTIKVSDFCYENKISTSSLYRKIGRGGIGKLRSEFKMPERIQDVYERERDEKGRFIRKVYDKKLEMLAEYEIKAEPLEIVVRFAA